MEEFYGFLVFTVILSVALFLPVLIELKKPKDSGPRKIVNFETATFLKAQKEPEMGKQSLSGNKPIFTLDSLTNIEV
jgi:hypothetical protein